VYAAIETIVAEGCSNTTETCRILKVNRTAFYAWKNARQTIFEEQDDELSPLIRVIFRRHRRRYGARRIIEDLKELGHVCSRRKVSSIMKTLHLKAIQPKSFVPKTTDSRHRLGYSPNLLFDADEPTGVNQIWVGDITYISLEDGTFCYLAILMDLFSRRIVGWHLADDMTESLVLRALRLAVKERQPQPGLIHHSDRGGQYAGNEYRAVLRRAGALQSMSRAGDCYDKAFMESCFGTIKTELEMTDYENSRQARKEIARYIRYYDFERRHSGIGYCSPAQFEQIINLTD
jgi:transposase InsO family protein